MTRCKFPWFGFVLLWVPFSGCTKSEKGAEDPSIAPRAFDSEEKAEEYLAAVSGFRKEKDEFFKHNEGSPLKDEERITFQGLRYYEPTEEFIFRVTLQKYEDPESLKMGTTTGDLRDAIRYGYFDFAVRGRTQRVHVYRFLPEAGSLLFVPFTDPTNGKDTYGAGRYLDFVESRTDTYLLDFNLAYSPSCAYNENYSCPIPPKENRLGVAIEAGEKTFH